MKKMDPLMWGAMIAALVGTASAEYTLAIACGFAPWFAWCVPAALDLYTIRALRAGRDVACVVLAMIVVNAISHLVSAGLLQASVSVVVGVSAIAPLVLWRVHLLQLREEQPAPQAETVEPQVEEREEESTEDELSLVDQLLMLGEPLPGRKTVMETYGVSEWEARKALEEAKAKLEQAISAPVD